MVIAGAGGHAREIMGILSELQLDQSAVFFDDISKGVQPRIWDRFDVIQRIEALKDIFAKDSRFVIGVGKPAMRKQLFEKMLAAGGRPFSVVSPFARVGPFQVKLEEGLNIMTHALITQDVVIGKGTLVHMQASIHHDCRVGEFCELSPACRLLGRVTVGDLVSIGAGAIILPGITIESQAVIGAGAVVTRNVPGGAVVKGIPAR